MAEELLQFLLKLKEEGIDLSKTQIWFNPACHDNSGYLDPEEPFKYYPDYKEVVLIEK